MKVYLAGPITGLSFDDAVDWRVEFGQRLEDIGIKAVSPMRGKAYLSKEKRLGDIYEGTLMSGEQAMVGRDHFDVAHCEVSLLNFLGAERTSIGSVMELQRAFDYDKYCLVIMEPGNVHDHAFVRRAASIIVRSLDDAFTVLATLNASYE